MRMDVRNLCETRRVPAASLTTKIVRRSFPRSHPNTSYCAQRYREVHAGSNSTSASTFTRLSVEMLKIAAPWTYDADGNSANDGNARFTLTVQVA